jgi:hypothetical protein
MRQAWIWPGDLLSSAGSLGPVMARIPSWRCPPYCRPHRLRIVVASLLSGAAHGRIPLRCALPLIYS